MYRTLRPNGAGACSSSSWAANYRDQMDDEPFLRHPNWRQPSVSTAAPDSASCQQGETRGKLHGANVNNWGQFVLDLNQSAILLKAIDSSA